MCMSGRVILYCSYILIRLEANEVTPSTHIAPNERMNTRIHGQLRSRGSHTLYRARLRTGTVSTVQTSLTITYPVTYPLALPPRGTVRATDSTLRGREFFLSALASGLASLQKQCNEVEQELNRTSC